MKSTMKGDRQAMLTKLNNRPADFSPLISHIGREMQVRNDVSPTHRDDHLVRTEQPVTLDPRDY